MNPRQPRTSGGRYERVTARPEPLDEVLDREPVVENRRPRRPKPDGPPQTVEEADRDQEERRAALEKLIRRQSERGHYGEDGDKPPQSASPWLVIRNIVTDLGTRPIVGEPYWKSPDIWIESSDPSGNGVAGEDNYVHARVFNLGMTPAAPVQVDFYWADPSFGLGASTMNLIGSEWVAIDPIESVEVRCNTPWVPVYLNNGHECLMVNSTNHILDPIINPFKPVVDRHVGQRNVTVLEGSAADTLPFSIMITNLLAVGMTTFVRGRVRRFAFDRDDLAKLGFAAIAQGALAFAEQGRRVETRAGRATRDPAKAEAWRPPIVTPVMDGASPRLHAAVSGSLGFLPPASDVARRGVNDRLVEAGPAQFGWGSIGLVEDLALKPFEVRRLDLELTIPGDARPTELFVVDLEHGGDGLHLGGYTVVLRVLGGDERFADRQGRQWKGVDAMTNYERTASAAGKDRRAQEARRGDLERLIIDEVDEARETYELVEQLIPALPIKHFGDLRDATAGEIRFRGNPFDIGVFEDLLPDVLFPIDDVEKLVQLAYQAVQAAPPHITYDLEDPANARREMRRSLIRRLVGDGGLRPARSSGIQPFGAGRDSGQTGERPG